MKKTLALILAFALCLSMVACGGAASSSTVTTPADSGSTATPAATGPVELNVVTSFGGDDGNRPDYEVAYKAWEAATGNTVLDGSATYNEEQKAKIMTLFETGAEPDVLYYFNGADANKLIENDKVVSLEEIREYSETFANNMNDDKMQASCASPVDGKVYAIPLIGYWEGLFVNKAVLEAANVTVPDATTTYEDFLAMCEEIKASGVSPIAVSLAAEPHYWFEYLVYNIDGAEKHNAAPAAKDDETYKAWAAGLDEFKNLNDKGYFTVDAMTCSNGEAVDAFLNGDAAFLLDGSWRLGGVLNGVTEEQYDDFAVTYVPGTDVRPTTELIGGLSMGYYITRKAWDDPAKRDAAISFVRTVTQDNVVSSFNQTAVNALTEGSSVYGTPDNVTQSALDMTKNSTAVAAAAQDNVDQTKRDSLFKLVVDVAAGNMTGAEAVDSALGF